MKLLRTIRLDASDTFVFERAAMPGEWAIPGGFVFADRDPATLNGRDRQAFRAGFLGIGSFGWSTLAVVVSATVEERAAVVSALAAHLLAEFGAPDAAVAHAAAEAEIAFAAELAELPEQTLVALHRTIAADGALSERFRNFLAADAGSATRMPCSAGAFAIVEEAEDATGEAGDDDAAGQAFDLVGTVAGAGEPVT